MAETDQVKRLRAAAERISAAIREWHEALADVSQEPIGDVGEPLAAPTTGDKTDG